MRISKRWNHTFSVGISVSCFLALAAVPRAQAQQPPVYEVDPTWPKPLPNHWLMQGVPVMVTDKDDHIWVFNRPRDINPDENGAATKPPRTECCVIGPEVLEFDTDGRALRAWEEKNYVPGWPGRLQTIGVDRDEQRSECGVAEVLSAITGKHEGAGGFQLVKCRFDFEWWV